MFHVLFLRENTIFLMRIQIVCLQSRGRGPPFNGGPVMWRWEICIYIKGGEMERLFLGDIFIVNLFIFGFIFGRIPGLRWCFGFGGFLGFFIVFVVGNIPAASLELERGDRNQFFYRSPAINAFGQGFAAYLLQNFKFLSARFTLVFIKGHELSCRLTGKPYV
jgi:hypothetical protein